MAQSGTPPAGGLAYRVYTYDDTTIGNRNIYGGPAVPVYFVSDIELFIGTYTLTGQPQGIPVYEVDPTLYDVYSGPAVPVYVVVGILHTYYIDSTNGNDANDGHSIGGAWRTIPKVNATTFLPGDRILFKCGETWSGTRLVNHTGSNGVAGNPIYFGSYDIGAPPILSAGGATSAVWLDIFAHYYTFDNIDFRDGTASTVQIDGDHVTIQNCNVQGGVDAGISGWKWVDHLTIDNCTIHHNTHQGIQVAYTSLPGPTSITITNNVCYLNGSSTPYDHGIYLINVQNFSIKGNECYDNEFGAGIKVRDGLLNGIVEKNKCYSNLRGFSVDGDATHVIYKNNLLYLNEVHGLLLGSTATGFEFYNNTFVQIGDNDYDYAIELSDIANLSNIFKNNIVIVDASGNPVMTVRDPMRCAGIENVAGNTFDNNCYMYIGSNSGEIINIGGVGGQTLLTWQALAGSPDPNSISVDPVFVTSYTDLHLSIISPCLGAGMDCGITDDYDGNSRPYPTTGIDIGAYEYQGLEPIALTLQPDSVSGFDTGIESGLPNDNFGTNPLLEVGVGINLGIVKRAMLRFDFSSIPAGSTILVANLILNAESANTVDPYNIGAYRALTQWYAGVQNGAPPGAANGSTWNKRNANTGAVLEWGASTPGGQSGVDYTAVATDKVTVTTQPSIHTLDISADVAAWIAGTSNYGIWLINDDEGVVSTRKAFGSCEDATATSRPKLYILYLAP